MLDISKVFIVIPAHNAAKTLERTIDGLPKEIKNIVLVNDGSTDDTLMVATRLNLQIINHEVKRGYGAVQKAGYRYCLNNGAEYVVMVHSDFQYDPRLALIMAEIISLGNCDIVLGNRIRSRKEALEGGMPRWRYLVNRISTFGENVILGMNLGDFHSGLRAYGRHALQQINFELNSDNFAFDQQLLVQARALELKIGDLPTPVRYYDDSSSINIRGSLRYGWGAVKIIARYKLHTLGFKSTKFLPAVVQN